MKDNPYIIPYGCITEIRMGGNKRTNAEAKCMEWVERRKETEKYKCEESEEMLIIDE